MARDLAALTPPAVVCIAFLIGVAAFLRWSMAPKRNARADPTDEPHISPKPSISDADAAGSAPSLDRDAAEDHAALPAKPGKKR